MAWCNEHVHFWGSKTFFGTSNSTDSCLSSIYVPSGRSDTRTLKRNLSLGRFLFQSQCVVPKTPTAGPKCELEGALCCSPHYFLVTPKMFVFLTVASLLKQQPAPVSSTALRSVHGQTTGPCPGWFSLGQRFRFWHVVKPKVQPEEPPSCSLLITQRHLWLP